MKPLETVFQFVQLINAHNVPELFSLMTPDHQFVDSLGTVISGHDRMREGWRRYFEMVPDYRIEIHRSFEDGLQVAMLGVARGTFSRGGRLDPADAWQTPAAWYAIVRDGQIAHWQVFGDNEPIRQRMARGSE